MAINHEDKRRRTNLAVHSIYDYVMGALWLCLGGFVLLRDKFGVNLDIDSVLLTIFGVSAVLYGAFRIYRGYKKRY